nr:MAG: hypothetical protein [brine shrimp arlivirus 1]
MEFPDFNEASATSDELEHTAKLSKKALEGTPKFTSEQAETDPIGTMSQALELAKQLAGMVSGDSSPGFNTPPLSPSKKDSSPASPTDEPKKSPIPPPDQPTVPDEPADTTGTNQGTEPPAPPPSKGGSPPTNPTDQSTQPPIPPSGQPTVHDEPPVDEKTNQGTEPPASPKNQQDNGVDKDTKADNDKPQEKTGRASTQQFGIVSVNLLEGHPMLQKQVMDTPGGTRPAILPKIPEEPIIPQSNLELTHAVHLLIEKVERMEQRMDATMEETIDRMTSCDKATTEMISCFDALLKLIEERFPAAKTFEQKAFQFLNTHFGVKGELGRAIEGCKSEIADIKGMIGSLQLNAMMTAREATISYTSPGTSTTTIQESAPPSEVFGVVAPPQVLSNPVLKAPTSSAELIESLSNKMDSRRIESRFGKAGVKGEASYHYAKWIVEKGASSLKDVFPKLHVADKIIAERSLIIGPEKAIKVFQFYQ